MSILVLKSTPWSWERERLGQSVLGVAPAQPVLACNYLWEGASGPYKALSCYKEVSRSNSSDHHCQITGCSTPPLTELCKDAPPRIMHTPLLILTTIAWGGIITLLYTSERQREVTRPRQSHRARKWLRLCLGPGLNRARLKFASLHFVLFHHLHFCRMLLLLSLSPVIFENVKKKNSLWQKIKKLFSK